MRPLTKIIVVQQRLDVMKNPSYKGRLFVVSAPSGAGKSTLCRQLVSRNKNLIFSISVTTRHPRPGEKDGKEYFFVSDAAFEAMRKRNEFLEYADVHGYYYGTPRHFVEEKRKAGIDVLLDIDVQGALAVKKMCPDAILIFITTPTFKELERRLRARLSETESDIQRRLADAREELRFMDRYEHHVVNDQVPEALKQLETIVLSESIRKRKKENMYV